MSVASAAALVWTRIGGERWKYGVERHFCSNATGGGRACRKIRRVDWEARETAGRWIRFPSRPIQCLALADSSSCRPQLPSALTTHYEEIYHLATDAETVRFGLYQSPDQLEIAFYVSRRTTPLSHSRHSQSITRRSSRYLRSSFPSPADEIAFPSSSAIQYRLFHHARESRYLRAQSRSFRSWPSIPTKESIDGFDPE